MNASQRVLNQQRQTAAPVVRTTPFTGPIAWERASLGNDDGLIRLDDGSRRELDAIVHVLRHNPLPTPMLVPIFSAEKLDSSSASSAATLA